MSDLPRPIRHVLSAICSAFSVSEPSFVLIAVDFHRADGLPLGVHDAEGDRRCCFGCHDSYPHNAACGLAFARRRANAKPQAETRQIFLRPSQPNVEQKTQIMMRFAA